NAPIWFCSGCGCANGAGAGADVEAWALPVWPGPFCPFWRL
ncbi:hypothetical protein AVDCRST_MAG94-6398, partial [uncultured Leptolyngbya sp.]